MGKPKIKEEVVAVCRHFLRDAETERGGELVFRCKDCGRESFFADRTRMTAGCRNEGCAAPRETDVLGLVAYYEGLHPEANKRRIWSRAREIVDESRERAVEERRRREEEESRRREEREEQERRAAAGPDDANGRAGQMGDANGVVRDAEPGMVPAQPEQRHNAARAASGRPAASPVPAGAERPVDGRAAATGGAGRARGKRADGGTGARERAQPRPLNEEERDRLLRRWYRATAKITPGEVVAVLFCGVMAAYMMYCVIAWVGGPYGPFSREQWGIEPTRVHGESGRAGTAGPSPSLGEATGLLVPPLGDAVNVESTQLNWRLRLQDWASDHAWNGAVVLAGLAAAVWSWSHMRAERVAANSFGPREKLRVDLVRRRRT